MKIPKVIIIGGGASGLMAASLLCGKAQVILYEKEKTVGRKFLVAGSGGFNLTNAAVGRELYKNYAPSDYMSHTLASADSVTMRNWLSELGIQTFVGSSGRVFPVKGIKPHEVLKSLVSYISTKGGEIYTNCKLVSLNHQLQPKLKYIKSEQVFSPEADVYIYALGGASWSVTGSDGTWTELFQTAGIPMLPFQPSNCGVDVAWPKAFRDSFSGTPLKNARYQSGSINIAGEAMVTEYGLEGNAIYPLIPEIRKQLFESGKACIEIDFKPLQDASVLLAKLSDKKPGKDYARALNLQPVQLQLLKQSMQKSEYLDPIFFVNRLKKFPVESGSLRPISEAISVVGGFPLEKLNEHWQVSGHPQVYIIGEMANWDAPTGGFLLQGCFASAYRAVQNILNGFYHESI